MCQQIQQTKWNGHISWKTQVPKLKKEKEEIENNNSPVSVKQLNP